MFYAIFIIIAIIFYCGMPPALQLGAILINILTRDTIPYIDEIIMIGIYLAGKVNK